MAKLLASVLEISRIAFTLMCGSSIVSISKQFLVIYQRCVVVEWSVSEWDYQISSFYCIFIISNFEYNFSFYFELTSQNHFYQACYNSNFTRAIKRAAEFSSTLSACTPRGGGGGGRVL